MKKVLNYILNLTIVLVSILLFFSIFFDIQTTFLKKTYRSFFGISAFEIKTGSMENKINVGDLVIVKNTKNVGLNDIVTFETNGSFVTHRVVQLFGDQIVTKGDANNTDDDPITSDNIIGKVVLIVPKLGFIKYLIFKTEVMIPLIVVIFMITLIIDDREDGNISYLHDIKEMFKKKKKVTYTVPEDIKLPKETKEDNSKTMVLSKIAMTGNGKVYEALKDNKVESDDPQIIEVLEE